MWLPTIPAPSCSGGGSLFEYTYQEQQVNAFTFLGFNESESHAFYERKADGRQEGSPRPLAQP